MLRSWSRREARQSVGTGSTKASVGGDVGTTNEAHTYSAWPNYEAAYLAKRLGADRPDAAEANKYDTDTINFPDEVGRITYLDKIANNYRNEADECLKAEFVDWLQGTHKDNTETVDYANGPGKPRRVALFAQKDGPSSKNAGEELTSWKPTWWGRHQLTYLPGVREFLREQKVKSGEAEFNMNLLAEFGPSNLEQAWAYFKHWVKGRPIGNEECLHPSKGFDATPEYGAVRRAGPTHMGRTQDGPIRGYGGVGAGPAPRFSCGGVPGFASCAAAPPASSSYAAPPSAAPPATTAASDLHSAYGPVIAPVQAVAAAMETQPTSPPRGSKRAGDPALSPNTSARTGGGWSQPISPIATPASSPPRTKRQSDSPVSSPAKIAAPSPVTSLTGDKTQRGASSADDGGASKFVRQGYKDGVDVEDLVTGELLPETAVRKRSQAYAEAESAQSELTRRMERLGFSAATRAEAEAVSEEFAFQQRLRDAKKESREAQQRGDQEAIRAAALKINAWYEEKAERGGGSASDHRVNVAADVFVKSLGSIVGQMVNMLQDLGRLGSDFADSSPVSSDKYAMMSHDQLVQELELYRETGHTSAVLELYQTQLRLLEFLTAAKSSKVHIDAAKLSKAVANFEPKVRAAMKELRRKDGGPLIDDSYRPAVLGLLRNMSENVVNIIRQIEEEGHLPQGFADQVLEESRRYKRPS